MSKNMRVLLAIMVLLNLGLSGCSQDSIQHYLADTPFPAPAITLPIFPSNELNISDMGAVGDAHTINTTAIQQTIDKCAASGGGRVVIDRGIWLTGPIEMKSNIDLHLKLGATLQFIGDFENYPLRRGTWEGQGEVRCVSPIFGKDLENVGITGPGIIDGAGDQWRPVKISKLTSRAWKTLLKSGGVVTEDGKVWWPSEGAMNGRELVNELNSRGDATIEEYAPAREYLRPVMINLVNCKNVLLDGTTFQNSPAWNIHPLMCTNVVVRNITVRNPWYSQNGDGIDLESCKDVLLVNSRFDVGDDAICIKSGKNKYGRDRGIPTQNVIIKDCIVYHGHGGFTVGSEMSGGVKNIFVDNCTFLGTDVGLRFKSTRGRGGVVENIHISNIYMENIVMEAIRFNLFYAMKEPIPQVESDGLALFKEVAADPITDETPSFKDIYMDNIVSRNAGQSVLLYGLPEMAIKNVNMTNMKLSSDVGVILVDSEEITFKNIDLVAKKEPAFLMLNARGIKLDNVVVPQETKLFLSVSGIKTEAITLANMQRDVNSAMISTAENLNSDVVSIVE